MDESQLEDYRRRMREKYLNRAPEAPVAVAIEPTPKPIEEEEVMPMEPGSATAVSTDGGAVHKTSMLQEIEYVRPPLDIQKEERLVEPAYYYSDPEARPLIDPVEKKVQPTCMERLKRDCGYKTWGSAWVIIGVLVAVAAVLVIVLVFYR